MIRSASDTHEFPAIQPIQFAARAIVDDHVAAAAVVVGIHSLFALRAVDYSAKPLRVRSSRSLKCASLLGSKIVYQGDKDCHGDQASAAMGAVKNAAVIDNGML